MELMRIVELMLESGRKGSDVTSQEPGGACRKDEARPLVRVSVLCSVQCFDNHGWVRGRTSGARFIKKNLRTNLGKVRPRLSAYI